MRSPPPSSEWRTLTLYSPPHFLSYLQTSKTQRYLEHSCFGVLSRQISFWTFLEFQLTILACKLYASCTCVNIKFRVHVYSVFVWILLDSLVAVTVTVCRFSFASVTPKIRQICIICLWFPLTRRRCRVGRLGLKNAVANLKYSLHKTLP